MTMNNDFERMMRLAPRVKLEEVIEEAYHPNTLLEYGVEDVRGVQNTKGFIHTKANLEGRNLGKMNLVPPNYFAFNRRTTRNGERLGLGYNNTQRTFICTEDYVVFRVKEERKEDIDPAYLYLTFLSSEFDRYVRWDSWGSATEFFNWENMQRVVIPLPSMEVQRELVAVYDGLRQMAEQNEAMLKPLADACHAYIVDCKEKYPAVKLGEYIEERSQKNSDGKITIVRGLCTQKCFREPNSRVNKKELSGYKICEKGDIAFVPTTDTWKGFACAVCNEPQIVVSPIYNVFRIKDKQSLDPEFLYLFFARKEYDRYARYNSWGSARENFSYSDLERVQIPLPPIEVQQSIVSLYRCAEEAKAIAQEAREQMRTICPALIQRATQGVNGPFTGSKQAVY